MGDAEKRLPTPKRKSSAFGETRLEVLGEAHIGLRPFASTEAGGLSRLAGSCYFSFMEIAERQKTLIQSLRAKLGDASDDEIVTMALEALDREASQAVELRRIIDESRASGEATPLTPADIADIEARGLQRLEALRKQAE